MKITKHMQSCFLIETNGVKVLLDPGHYVFEEEGLLPREFDNVNVLVFTHEHGDHFDWENVKEIVKNNKPVVFGTTAVIETIQEKFPNIDLKILGDKTINKVLGLQIEGHISKHGPLPNGNPAPNVSGVVIDDSETRFYSPGDSVLLNPAANADIIAVPFCGQVVMDIKTAKAELLKLKPRIAIPIHYDSPKYPVDVNDFVGAMENAGIEVKVLKNGENLDWSK